MKYLGILLSVLFFVGCGGGGSSSPKILEEVTFDELNKGGYIFTANIYNIANSSKGIEGVKGYFCENQVYKEVYPDGRYVKGGYIANSKNGTVVLYFPTHTATIYNGSDHIFAGNSYNMISNNVTYSFVITKIEKVDNLNCNWEWKLFFTLFN